MAGIENPPAFPVEVSSNGAEIWDWAARLSEHRRWMARIADLRAHIARRPRECGACQYWMARTCPREVSVNGRKQGPSMKAPICATFSINPRDAANIEKMKGELEALRTAEGQP